MLFLNKIILNFIKKIYTLNTTFKTEALDKTMHFSKIKIFKRAIHFSILIKQTDRRNFIIATKIYLKSLKIAALNKNKEL
jgi:hypothetical protein